MLKSPVDMKPTKQDVIAACKTVEIGHNELLASFNAGVGPQRADELMQNWKQAHAEYTRVITEWAKAAIVICVSRFRFEES
jgi:hypothetical protein